jgi:putative transposase
MTASAAGTMAEPGRRVRQKAGLNRSILNQGWGAFDLILTYKMEERGGRVVKIDPAFTSQTCSVCGVVDARSRKSQAIFECVRCGYRDNADRNAARNIVRRWNTSPLRMEGLQERPYEVRTGRRLTPSENPRPSGRGSC